MQWQFRKTLESFEGYKRTVTYKNQIQNGDESTLDVVVRQIELILTDKNQKILPKVLAMRFARDIMVLGQEDIVKRVQKLVPTLTRICSHDLTSVDPDRGETFFHDHPAYLKSKDQEEKKQIDTLGSTFLILSLQSVYHWAKWIPLDLSGQQSIYAKAYNSLVDRGVTFPTSFHYYKQSDTEKFKNMYKMQFFTDSYESAYSEALSSVAQSQVSQVQLKQSRKSGSGWDKKSKVQSAKELQSSDEYTGQARHLQTVNDIVQFLGEMKQSKTRKMGVLREIHKKVQDMYEVEAGLGRLPKNEKRWLETYMINFSLLNSSMIDYEEFLQRGLSEEVVLQHGMQEEDISINKQRPKQTPMKLYQTSKQVKEGSKLKNEPSGSRVGSEINKQQQYEFKVKINALMVELEQKENQLNIVKSNSEKQKNRLIQDYQSRIGAIKTQIKKGHQDRGTLQKQLQKQNDKLKGKIIQLEEQLRNKQQYYQTQMDQLNKDKNNVSYDHSRQRELESERNQLLTKVKRLELQNEKLIQVKTNSKNYDKELVNLEAALKQKQIAFETARAQLRKAQKRCQNYQDQANLYKSELLTERAKHQQKMNGVVKTKDILESQNKTLKEKVLEFRKSLDVREVQTLNLREEVKRYQGKVKDLNDKKSTNQNYRADQWNKSRTGGNFLSPGKLGNSPQVEPYGMNSERRLKFNNYEDLYNELKPSNKQLFIRLCRCGLKKKDILLKENQMEIGIISEIISQCRLKFVLHFTNTSEKQVENLKIEFNMGHSYVSTLDYQIQNKYIFCIQPQEQEKVSVIVTNRQPPFLKERAILEVSFEKNGIMYNSNIFLPFLIPKFYDFYKPKGIKISDKNPRQVVQLRFNKKMLPKNNSLKSFFEQIEQIAPNQYEIDAYHRETDLTVRILFTLTPDTESMKIEAVTMREKINERQRYVFEELVSFLEVAFKR